MEKKLLYASNLKQLDILTIPIYFRREMHLNVDRKKNASKSDCVATLASKLVAEFLF